MAVSSVPSPDRDRAVAGEQALDKPWSGDIDYLCMNSRTDRDEIPAGMLDLLVLRTLARHGRLHGFEIAEAIRAVSTDVLHVEEGSLYPALQRMMLKGWIRGEWGRTAENRRARYYQMTAAGRKRLAYELSTYRRVTAAITRVLRPA